MNIVNANTGRTAQKERTRQKLLSAARALAEEGEALTVAKAAERANLAELTAIATIATPETCCATRFPSIGQGSPG